MKIVRIAEESKVVYSNKSVPKRNDNPQKHTTQSFGAVGKVPNCYRITTYYSEALKEK